MKFKYYTKWMKAVLFLILSLISQIGLSATTPDFKTGKWQTIVDGEPGEGAIFYRLDFKNSGIVEITKQMGGVNLIEKKQWNRKADTLIIVSNPGAKITEFDSASLIMVNSELLHYKYKKYQGHVKPFNQVPAIIHWILILVVLIILNELFRKSKWATVAFFFVLPLVLTPTLWANQGVTYWFKWVKVYSVIFAVIWFTFIRYSQKFHKFNFVKLIAALFLAVNIAEAVMQDFSMGFLPNILNGIAGVLSIITLFYGWKQIGPDNSKKKDMIWPLMPILWIVAYDVWNIVYVYLNFPGSTSAQFMVLLACTIPAMLIKKGTWLQARAFTLAAWFMYYFTFPRFTEQMELLVPRNETLMLSAALLSIVLNVVYFGVFVKRIWSRN